MPIPLKLRAKPSGTSPGIFEISWTMPVVSCKIYKIKAVIVLSIHRKRRFSKSASFAFLKKRYFKNIENFYFLERNIVPGYNAIVDGRMLGPVQALDNSFIIQDLTAGIHNIQIQASFPSVL